MINDTLGWACGTNNSLIKTTDGGQTWQTVTTPGYSSDYWWIDFMDEEYGFLACNNGIVLKTIDGGNTWQQIQAGAGSDLFSVDIIDSLHIATAGVGGRMNYSSDGGNNWVQHDNMAYYPAINCIKFVNADTGYVVGDDYGLRKTTNRGNSWFVPGFNDIGEYEIDLHADGYGFAAGTSLRLDKTINGFDNWQRLIMNDNFVDVDFINDQVGYIVGTTYTGWPFLKTTDGGENWFTVPNYPDSIMGTLSTVYFIDSLHGFLGGATLIYTTDGGETWTEANGITNGISKIFFINNQTGWAAGEQRIFKTTDGGINWNEQANSITDSFTSLYFKDSLNGWATNRYLWQTTDGGNNWIERTDLPSYLFSKDIYFIDSVGFVTNLLELEKTTDAGNNWFTQFNSTYIIRTLGWLTNKHGFIIGDGVYETEDTGETWNEIISLRNIGLIRINNPYPYVGYAVGYNGLIYNYIDTTYTPVELTNFVANQTNNNIKLSWATVSETNNKGFEIERQDVSRQLSVGNWKKIGYVQGKGTTTEPQSYSFNDKDITNGKYKYRIKQIDFNGTYKYSKEIEINISIPLKFSLSQNYPNPFNPSTNIGFTIPDFGFVTLKIYDVLGREVKITCK